MKGSKLEKTRKAVADHRLCKSLLRSEWSRLWSYSQRKRLEFTQQQ